MSKCLVCLDATPEALAAAADVGAEAVVSHHPLIYNPLQSLGGDSTQIRAIRAAFENRIAVITAHTNWDAASGGVNDTLAALLGLSNIRPFGNDIPALAYKLVTFVPERARNEVLDALANIGCGVIGLYRRCAFISRGTGTYEPQPGANPLIGAVGQREETDEERIEILVPGHLKSVAIETLREAHPYDEPAFDLYQVANVTDYSLGRIGELSPGLTLDSLQSHIARCLETQTRAHGSGSAMVRFVAVVGGAGGRYWQKAMDAGADALVTGEVKHHEAVDASESGFCVIEAGHYATEQPGIVALKDRLHAEVSGVEFKLWEPLSGRSGRPLQT